MPFCLIRYLVSEHMVPGNTAPAFSLGVSHHTHGRWVIRAECALRTIPACGWVLLLHVASACYQVSHMYTISCACGSARFPVPLVPPAMSNHQPVPVSGRVTCLCVFLAQFGTALYHDLHAHVSDCSCLRVITCRPGTLARRACWSHSQACRLVVFGRLLVIVEVPA